MRKRIVIAIGVLATLFVAGVLLYIDWRANHDNRRAVRSVDHYRRARSRARMNPAALRATQAYRIDREGRRLEARAKSPADLKKAEAKYQESLAIFRELKHRRGEAEVLNDLGIFYSDRRRYAEAEEYFEKALKIKREIGWHWGAGNTLAGLSVIYHRQGDLSKAVEYSEQAVKAYEKARNKKSTASMLCSLADLYVLQGSPQKAIRALTRAARIAGERGADKIRMRALNRLGMLDLPFSEPTKAEARLKEALALARKRGDPDDIAQSLALLASLHSNRGENSKALPYLEECSKITEKLKQREVRRLTLYALGDMYERVGRYVDAADAYEKSLKLFPKDGDLIARIELLDRSCRIHALNGDYPKAAEHGVEMLRLLEESGLGGNENRVRENLSKIYEKWAEADPENGDLKKLKAFLGK